jgi:hypothetical protein
VTNCVFFIEIISREDHASAEDDKVSDVLYALDSIYFRVVQKQ